METGATVLLAVASAVALLCLLLKNSFPTIIMLTNLQLVYFNLFAMSRLHPATAALTHIKATTGYNDGSLFSSNDAPSVNRRAAFLGYSSSFASNFNIMLICQLGLLGIAVVTYVAAT